MMTSREIQIAMMAAVMWTMTVRTTTRTISMMMTNSMTMPVANVKLLMR